MSKSSREKQAKREYTKIRYIETEPIPEKSEILDTIGEVRVIG